MPKRDHSISGPSLGAAADLTVAEAAGSQSGQPARAPGHAAASVVPEAAGIPASAGQHPQLGADLQAMIGQQLRAVYHEILNEPVPDRFVRLLKELAAKEASHL